MSDISSLDMDSWSRGSSKISMLDFRCTERFPDVCMAKDPEKPETFCDHNHLTPFPSTHHMLLRPSQIPSSSLLLQTQSFLNLQSPSSQFHNIVVSPAPNLSSTVSHCTLMMLGFEQLLHFPASQISYLRLFVSQSLQ